MVLSVVRPEMAMDFSFKEVESMLDEGGLSMDSPRTVMRLLKVRIDVWTENFPCEIACMLFLDMRSMNDV